MNKKISFYVRVVADYKLWLYKALDRQFPGRFYMLHGQEIPGTVPRDYGALPVTNDVRLRNRYWALNGVDLIWAPCLSWILKNRPDVIILQDGVRIVSNYFVHLIGKLLGAKIIYYTHGHDHQADWKRGKTSQNVLERIRRFLFRQSDALIVYTEANKSYLRQQGISTEMFVSANTLDTDTICGYYSKMEMGITKKVKQSIGAAENQRVIAFLGRLVPEKKVDLFVDVMRELNQLSPHEFVGLVLGDGPCLPELKDAAANLPVRFVGYHYGPELAKYLTCCDCVFLPTRVGLAVVEAFCAGKPFITSKGKYHGPEIDYIEHNANGLILDSNDYSEVAREINELLNDEQRLSRMSLEARKTVNMLSPEVSVKAFEDAIDCATGAAFRQTPA